MWLSSTPQSIVPVNKCDNCCSGYECRQICHAYTDMPFTLSSHNFYPRPVLAFGYCRCLRLCVFVSVCVYQSRVCPHDNSPLVQAKITKFGTKMQKTLVKVSIVFGDYRPWPSRSNLTWKSNFTSFWACPPHNSSAVQARITKFGPNLYLSTVNIPINFGLDWFDLHLHFESWNQFSTKFICALFVLYLVRPVVCKY